MLISTSVQIIIQSVLPALFLYHYDET